MDEFKNPTASAPESCSGSSGTDDEDEDSGETEDMDHYDPSVIKNCLMVSTHKFSLRIFV